MVTMAIAIILISRTGCSIMLIIGAISLTVLFLILCGTEMKTVDKN